MDKEVYLQLREKYKKIKPDRVKENISEYSLKEQTIAEIWYKSLFDRRNLTSVDGRKVIIVSVGEYNTVSVPDFVNAKIIVDGKEYSGDVEVHKNRSDWFKHKHHKNSLYKNVILHVFYNNDTRTPVKEDIIELCLKDRINPEFFEEDSELFYSSKESLCGKSIQIKDYNLLEQLILSAAEARLNIKSEQFFCWFKTKTKEEQMLYERICETFGYSNNRDNFLLISKIAPIKKIRKIVKRYRLKEQKIIVDTIFFCVSGLLNRKDVLEHLPQYYISLKTLWEKEIKKYFKKTIDSSRWRYYKTRPVNYPERRIAALSMFVSKIINVELQKLLLGLIKLKDEKDILVHIKNFLYQPPEGYFAKHCRFGGKEFSREYPLWGMEKVSSLLANVIFPYLVYKSKQTKDEQLYKKVIKIYTLLDIKEKNSIAEKFLSSIILYPEYRKYFLSKNIFIQGLLQIYKDFCEPNRGICKNCFLPEILKYEINQEDKSIKFLEL